jgi:replicative DNA helicase
LPVVNTILNKHGIAFRRGQFSLIFAAPGVGKTVFASNLALFTRVPTVYFSADSDEWTTRVRVCGTLSGQKLEQVEKHLTDESWASYYDRYVSQADHIDWCFRVDIEPEFIANRLLAYEELRGESPELIVVDNLGNSIQDSDNEYSELRDTCRELQRMARKTRAHVMALHHVVGSKEDGNKPLGLSDLIGKVGKLPELVIGLHRAGAGHLGVTIPKQRLGRGDFEIQVPIAYETARVGGY